MLSTFLITCRAESDDSHPIWTVTFDADGGNGKITAKSIEDGGTVSRPKNTTLKKAGYVDFNASTGEWKKADGTIFRFSDDKNPNKVYSDITLRPSWKTEKNTNTPDASNPGTSNPQGNDPSKPNDPNSQGTDPNNSGSEGESDGEKKKTFTIYFNAGDGEGERADETVGEGETYYLPNGEGFSYEGHVFVGWTSDANGMEYSIGSAVILEYDTRFIAKWGEKHEISFNSNGGYGYLENRSAEVGEKIELLGAEYVNTYVYTKENYTFIGWGEREDSKTPLAEQYTVRGSAVLFAIWQGEPCALSISEGGITRQLDAHYGDEVLVASTTTKENYTFLGWALDENAKTAQYRSGEKYRVAGDALLFEMWEGKNCTLTFNNTEGGQTTRVNAHYGDEYIMHCDIFTNSGKCFDFWQKENAGSAQNMFNSGDSYKVLGDAVFYASWKVGAIVNFSANGGEGATIKQNATNGKVTVPTTTFTKENYEFKGFATSQTATVAQYQAGDVFPSGSSTVTQSATLYAVWEGKECTIKLLPNTNSTSSYIMTGKYGETITIITPTIAAFKKAGHTQKGWAGTREATSVQYSLESTYTVRGDASLYAVWEANKYNVYYKKDSSSPLTQPFSVEYGKSVQLNQNPFSKEHYYFTGYKQYMQQEDGTLMPDGSGRVLREGASVPIYRNTVFVAQWEMCKVVSFGSNGGEGEQASLYVKPGDEVTLPRTTTFTKKGHTFIGWATSISATSTISSYTVNENEIFYALWKKNNYKITFNSNGGSGTQSPITKEYGTVVGLPSTTSFTKNEATFTGWVASQNDTTPIPSSYTISDDAILYALWKINTYTITFDANGGGGTQSPITKEYGTTVQLPSETTFTKEQHTFMGWATSPSETSQISSYTINGNTILYAIWFHADCTIGANGEKVLEKYYSEDGTTDVVIPSGITSIGERAFWDCQSLTNITIPDSVTSIAVSAFECCYYLIEVKVDSSNQNYCNIDGILYEKDSNNKTLFLCPESAYKTTVNIPNDVTSIGRRAFGGCRELTSITIPNSVTLIGEYAFSGCRELTSITIPDSVTSIGNNAFNNCYGLKEIKVDSSNQNYYAVDGMLYSNINNVKILVCCPISMEKTSVTIPSDVNVIGDYSFCYSKNLTSVTIPSSVTSIGDAAFFGCENLTSVTISSGVTSIEYQAFSYCLALTSITIPSSVTSVGFSAFGGWKNTQTINVSWTEDNMPSGWNAGWNKSCNAQINYVESQ